ncbi:MAG: HNH endonuclease, partial [Blastocatellia bacterium]
CVTCSLRKGARRTAVDPGTGTEVRIFNPRLDDWSEFFFWEGLRLSGLNAIGRATIQALDLNRPLILAIREEEVATGRHP